MARLRYSVTAPDGTQLVHSTPEHAVHTKAVICLLRLRTAPTQKELEAGTAVRRFRQWVMIGTAENDRLAQRLAETHGYKHVAEQTLILDVVGELGAESDLGSREETEAALV